MKTLKDMDLKGKRVLVRVDFNVPLTDDGQVVDDERIKAVLPTINFLLEQDCKIILASHLGRPKGKDLRFSLKPVTQRLQELLNKKVTLVDNCLSPEIKALLVQPGHILLLENLRFYPGEEANNEEFVRRLVSFGEVFVQEAFACCHRAHASIVGPPKYLPSCAGFLLEKEVRFLSELLIDPERPFVAIIGGKKAETKAKLIDKISEIADLVLIGGLIKKEVEEKNITFKYPQKIIKPVDEKDGKDIGPKTIDLFKRKLLFAETVFWSGPLGNFEIEEYNEGTEEIAKAVAKVPFSVVGGGETVAAVKKAGVADKISHVSTGGGAALEFLEGKTLPGIAALSQGGEK